MSRLRSTSGRGARWLALAVVVPALAVAEASSLTWTSELRAQTPPVRLEPVADIGCAACGGPDEFGLVLGLAVGAGRVVVADRDAPHVRVFGTDGRALLSAGREGDGPGEVRFPMAVSAGPDGMAVVDMRASRVLTLDPQGAERGTLRLDRFPLAASFEPGGLGLDVSLADFREGDASIARWDAATGWRTLADGVKGLELRPPGEVPLYFSLARAPGGGFVIGVSESYTLVFFDAEGSEVRRVVHPAERTAKTPDEIEKERSARTAAARRMAGAEGGSAGAVDIDPLRLHFRLDALRFDESGRLWVRTERGSDSTVFDLFDAAGDPLGQVAVPGRLDAFAVGGGFLAAAVLGDFDVATVRVWKVHPSAP